MGRNLALSLSIKEKNSDVATYRQNMNYFPVTTPGEGQLRQEGGKNHQSLYCAEGLCYTHVCHVPIAAAGFILGLLISFLGCEIFTD